MRHWLWALTALTGVVFLASPAWTLSQGDEIEIGRRALTELRPVGFVREPALSLVGEALKEKAERKDLPWQFWVLEEEKDLNAFALPGGFVFITRRYYEMLDGDELAFVVGHEMAHIDKRHFEQKLKRAKQAQLYDILAGVIIGATKASRGWGTVADIGTTAYFTKYSRKLEKEADLGGYLLAKEAGFDAHRAVSALSKLGEDRSDPIFQNIFATHPLLSSREERLAVLGDEEGGPPPRRVAFKVARPDWKPSRPTRDELKKRPGLAVRVVGEDGERWERKWRGDFRRLLSEEIELAGKYDVRGEERADGKKEPKLSELQKRDRADHLLLVVVQQMSADLGEPSVEKGSEVLATVRLSAKLIEASSGKETPLGEIQQVRQGRDFLPVDGGRLHPDMTITQAVVSASRLLAARLSLFSSADAAATN